MLRKHPLPDVGVVRHRSIERRFRFSSPHVSGVHVAIDDGIARFLAESTDADVLQFRTTCRGEEVLSGFYVGIDRHLALHTLTNLQQRDFPSTSRRPPIR